MPIGRSDEPAPFRGRSLARKGHLDRAPGHIHDHARRLRASDSNARAGAVRRAPAGSKRDRAGSVVQVGTFANDLCGDPRQRSGAGGSTSRVLPVSAGTAPVQPRPAPLPHPGRRNRRSVRGRTRRPAAPDLGLATRLRGRLPRPRLTQHSSSRSSAQTRLPMCGMSGQRCNNGTKREWCPASLAVPGSPRRSGRTETRIRNHDTE